MNYHVADLDSWFLDLPIGSARGSDELRQGSYIRPQKTLTRRGPQGQATDLRDAFVGARRYWTSITVCNGDGRLNNRM